MCHLQKGLNAECGAAAKQCLFKSVVLDSAMIAFLGQYPQFTRSGCSIVCLLLLFQDDYTTKLQVGAKAAGLKVKDQGSSKFASDSPGVKL